MLEGDIPGSREEAVSSHAELLLQPCSFTQQTNLYLYLQIAQASEAVTAQLTSEKKQTKVLPLLFHASFSAP